MTRIPGSRRQGSPLAPPPPGASQRPFVPLSPGLPILGKFQEEKEKKKKKSKAEATSPSCGHPGRQGEKPKPGLWAPRLSFGDLFQGDRQGAF